MKNINLNVKEKLIAKYLVKDQPEYKTRSTNINVLLNRIQLNKKNEYRKKIYFSLLTSSGLLLFGLIIFWNSYKISKNLNFKYLIDIES